VRLRPLTIRAPKPMVRVAGAPYLEHQLRLLAQQQIRDVLLLTGYLGEQIEDYFGDGAWLGLSIRYSREPQPVGTGGALREARALLAPSFLLIYGDSYLPIEYRAVHAKLEATGAEGVVAVYDNRLEHTSVQSNIELGRDGLVTRYQKDAGDLPYVEAGVLALSSAVVNRMPEHGAVSIENDIFPRLIAERRLAGFVTAQRFYDIGTPERLEIIERVLTHEKASWQAPSGCTIPP
jgi:NDP-sugar pyrophosphorylase family protein